MLRKASSSIRAFSICQICSEASPQSLAKEQYVRKKMQGEHE